MQKHRSPAPFWLTCKTSKAFQEFHCPKIAGLFERLEFEKDTDSTNHSSAVPVWCGRLIRLSGTLPQPRPVKLFYMFDLPPFDPCESFAVYI